MCKYFRPRQELSFQRKLTCKNRHRYSRERAPRSLGKVIQYYSFVSLLQLLLPWASRIILRPELVMLAAIEIWQSKFREDFVLLFICSIAACKENRKSIKNILCFVNIFYRKWPGCWLHRCDRLFQRPRAYSDALIEPVKCRDAEASKRLKSLQGAFSSFFQRLSSYWKRAQGVKVTQVLSLVLPFAGRFLIVELSTSWDAQMSFVWKRWEEVMDSVCCSIFLLEACVRIGAFGFGGYWKLLWNRHLFAWLHILRLQARFAYRFD